MLNRRMFLSLPFVAYVVSQLKPKVPVAPITSGETRRLRFYSLGPMLITIRKWMLTVPRLQSIELPPKLFSDLCDELDTSGQPIMLDGVQFTAVHGNIVRMTQVVDGLRSHLEMHFEHWLEGV